MHLTIAPNSSPQFACITDTKHRESIRLKHVEMATKLCRSIHQSFYESATVHYEGKSLPVSIPVVRKWPGKVDCNSIVNVIFRENSYSMPVSAFSLFSTHYTVAQHMTNPMYSEALTWLVEMEQAGRCVFSPAVHRKLFIDAGNNGPFHWRDEPHVKQLLAKRA